MCERNCKTQATGILSNRYFKCANKAIDFERMFGGIAEAVVDRAFRGFLEELLRHLDYQLKLLMLQCPNDGSVMFGAGKSFSIVIELECSIDHIMTAFSDETEKHMLDVTRDVFQYVVETPTDDGRSFTSAKLPAKYMEKAIEKFNTMLHDVFNGVDSKNRLYNVWNLKAAFETTPVADYADVFEAQIRVDVVQSHAMLRDD